MAEKGGTWKFKLQVDLPVHYSPASSFNQVDVAFRTFLITGKEVCVSNVEIFISNDGASSVQPCMKHRHLVLFGSKYTVSFRHIKLESLR